MVDFLAVGHLLTDTDQRIVLRRIRLVKNAVSLRDMLDQSFRETGTLQHNRIDAVKFNRLVRSYNVRRNILTKRQPP